MTSLPQPTLSLSADEARRIALRAQGFLGAPDRRGGVRGVLRHLGAVQLDTISVLARSHELIPYARLGAVGRDTVEKAYWSDRHAFEYWSHAACILPIEEWPHFAFRRRANRVRGHRWHVLQDKDRSTKAVLDRLRAEGPLTSSELGGAKNGGEWFEWSETKIAVEWLLDTGEVVCGRRRGWKRVYDLPERAVPEALLHDDLDDRECMRRLVALAGQSLGVGTRADIADYHRLKGEQVDAVIADSGLVPVEVEGWGKRAWADPAALATTPGAATARRCSPRSTRWSGTAPARSGSSASRTAWRPTSPSRSGYTGTSRCRCWRAGSCGAASTRAARGPPWWPVSSPWRRPGPPRPWPRPCGRPPGGWGARRCASSAPGPRRRRRPSRRSSGRGAGRAGDGQRPAAGGG